MGIGAAVRGKLGRFEQPAINLYRGAFISVDELARTMAEVVTAPALVGEIGCGDGSVINAMAQRWPTARFVGVDPAVTAGRLYEGQSADFRVTTSASLLGEYANQFDVTVLVDVLHHVADDERLPTLRDAAALTSPGGVVAVKEWEKRPGPAHMLAYGADRYVSGDASVRFMARPELEQLTQEAMPGWQIIREARVQPRQNNLLWMLRKPDA